MDARVGLARIICRASPTYLYADDGVERAEWIVCAFTGLGIFLPVPVDDEAIFVLPGGQVHPSPPRTFFVAAQSSDLWVPVVECAGDKHFVRVGGVQGKIDSALLGWGHIISSSDWV